MPRLYKECRNREEPKRVDYAARQIENAGYEIWDITKKSIHFIYKNEMIIFYPYTGWHTGKSIKDGRGIKNLLKQLKN